MLFQLLKTLWYHGFAEPTTETHFALPTWEKVKIFEWMIDGESVWQPLLHFFTQLPFLLSATALRTWTNAGLFSPSSISSWIFTLRWSWARTRAAAVVVASNR